MKLEKPGLMADIKVGDYVRVTASGEKYVTQVTRVTPQQFVVKKEGSFAGQDIRFWKKDGYSVGTYGWRTDYYKAEMVSESDFLAFKDQEKSLELMHELHRQFGLLLNLRSTPVPSSVLEQWLETIRSHQEEK